MQQIIECVPNFSEGNNMEIIKQITDEIKSIQGVKLLHVDPGKATNRTVATFVGEPGPVCEAAYRAVKKAAQLIDMRKQKGQHPRIGATDVCPLIPISGITMEEVVEYARKLAKRIGTELGIPVYCYGHAAMEEKRHNLANCRSGQYEGLALKMAKPDWKPDFGPLVFDERIAKTGASIVGARNYLIAYNVNLNTQSAKVASEIASEIREKGKIKREGNSPNGKIIVDAHGRKIYEPGMLKCVKGIGWYIEEYGIAQLSFNLTDYTVTNMQHVYEAACSRAKAHSLKTRGSELIGLVPLGALIDAGKYFLKKKKQAVNVPEEKIIEAAISALGLNNLAEFNPQKKVIEYLLNNR
jgi:glutamate formiminotransferase/formiminotetrahydrofolate cyclodeaminase